MVRLRITSLSLLFISSSAFAGFQIAGCIGLRRSAYDESETPGVMHPDVTASWLPAGVMFTYRLLPGFHAGTDLNGTLIPFAWGLSERELKLIGSQPFNGDNRAVDFASVRHSRPCDLRFQQRNEVCP